MTNAQCTLRLNSGLLEVVSGLIQDSRGRNLLNGLVAELEILLEGDRVGDSDKDNGACNQERSGTNTPLEKKSGISILFCILKNSTDREEK